ncbi:MAG: MmgE/PrpD family protein [Sphaerobacter sp.]|nr:MmgE/PrpD family protein [Sphaerobacter sp.]
MTLTTTLAEFIATTRYEDLPTDAITMARRSILDWLGSALRGGATQPARIAQAVAGRAMAGSDATLLATGGRLSALGAAFANGVASHVIELDDLHQASTFHPAAPIIPAALAVAERSGARGHALLRAVVLGYDVGIRVAEAVNPSHYRYWHPTGTCGVFGAAAAASALLDLLAAQVVQALGTAGTQASGLWEFLADGAMSKHLHAGMAAHDGILAADLAAAGFTGASRILEGPRGFFAATADTADAARVTDGLGRHFKIVENGFKRHACCGHTHTAVDAALILRARIAGRSIERVDIDTYRVALDITDNPTPRTPYEAKFSIQYAVAIALLDGRAGLEQFTEARMRRDDIASLLRRTSAGENPAHTAGYPAVWPARVRVLLTDGALLEETVEHPKGMPANPLTDAELIAKFHDLVDPVLGHHTAARLVEEVGRLEDDPPVGDLLLPLLQRLPVI